MQYLPEILKTSDSDQSPLIKELRSNAKVIVIDTIKDQIKDLIKSNNPKIKLKQKENKKLLDKMVIDYLDGRTYDDIGNWVYYPWRNTLIHLLPEFEFITVRTNRNKYKITPEEQDRLAQKKIGIIGLSVGQSVATTMAMERIFGEIRLADFDDLELSNLNRIRTGLYNLGVNKAVSVAREISEIDPYLKVTVFEKGLTEANMDQFFLENGKLDLLVEECDGLDMKVLARIKARELNIPVIMEASDRCMLDIERFDLEPDRPLLHGLLDSLSIEKLQSLSSDEEKVPYLLDMVGYQTISDRLKASMMEIESSITTWPQLASAVVMGGGISGEIARTILLGGQKESGRFYFDVHPLSRFQSDPVIVETKKISDPHSQSQQPPNPLMQIIDAGRIAPSVGNTQPWMFKIDKDTIKVYLVRSKDSQHILDHDYVGSLTSIGAAYINMVTKAALLGYGIKDEKVDLANPDSKPVLELTFDKNSPKPRIYTDPAKLADRKTNRSVKKSEPINKQDLFDIIGAIEVDSTVGFSFVCDNNKIETVAEGLSNFDKLRFLNEGAFNDVLKELRWSAEEEFEKRDGLTLDLFDLTASELAGWQLLKDPKIIGLLREWDLGDGLKKNAFKSFNSSGAIGLITCKNYNRATYLTAGKELQKFWLKCTEKEIVMHPMTAFTYIYQEVYLNQKSSFGAHRDHIYELGKKIQSEMDCMNELPLFVFRLSKNVPQTKEATRKTLKQVILN